MSDQPNESKLGLWSLVCLVVGSMIGAGAFALPQNIAEKAQTAAILLAWIITGIGITGLVFVFTQLNKIKPELQSGIYSYARAGFGDFIGFNSAWGYWLSAWIGNVSYAVLMFSALGFFFPQFGHGNTIYAIIGASLFLWSVHALILKGIKEAALVNILTTIAKIVPIIVFLVLCIAAFHLKNLTFNFWGEGLGSLFSQLKSTMLVTLWVFIGIEGAVVLSSRAKERSYVAKATVIGLVGTLSIYFLISILSLAAIPQDQLAHMQDPSMAYILQTLVGRWGAVLINMGLVISLIGAWLGWTLLCAELPYIAAKDNIMPKVFAKTNKNHSPSGSLWITNGLIQLFLIVVLFSQGTYLVLLKLATSCILLPYFFSALYAIKLLFQDNYYQQNPHKKLPNALAAFVGVLYGALLIFAAGLKLLLLSSILYAAGVLCYVWTKKSAGEKVFQPFEALLACIILVSAVVALALMLKFL